MKQTTEEQLNRILMEIRASRELNNEQHKQILNHAKESSEHAERIKTITDKWSNFWSVIMMVRNITFTVGFVVAMAYFITEWAELISGV